VGLFRIIGSVQTNLMAVNYEIKGQLARLLATEDLIVEHKKVSTACFNVHTRVLTLPLWERASNAIYDMLVAHEVGHALYTPDEDWTEVVKIPPSFVNIVEDARIEKLMKRRYGGLSKTMFNGYKELQDDDFFGIGEEDYNTYSLPDRVNLHFKVGNFIDVNFTEREKTLLNLIETCETFADVLVAAEEMYKLFQMEKEENVETSISLTGENEEDQNQQQIELVESEDAGESENKTETVDSESTTEVKETQASDVGGEHNTPEIKTDQRLREAIEELTNNSTWADENVYIELPTLDLKTIIASNQDVHDVLQKYWKKQEAQFIENGHTKFQDAFKFVDRDYVEFKKSAQKEVNYLVKEFECRKAADSYARASTARTGVLDCSKLHTYKYNEDLFKKVTTLADGKSHGLIFILDWSGSMDKVIEDTIKQLYNLIWFCKKVSIPFEVYAFTNEWRCVTYDDFSHPVVPKPHHKKKEGNLFIHPEFALMNLFTSKTKKMELDKQMLAIFRVVRQLGNRYWNNTYGIPTRLCLSGTPLNESLIALNQIIPAFQKQNKVQKVHTLVLTDGEASPLNYCVSVTRQEESYMGIRQFNPHKCFLRDRKTPNVYTGDRELDSYTQFTDMLIRYLRNHYSNVSFIGMRLLASGEAQSFMRRYHRHNQSEFDKLQADWKKQKTFSIRTKGYHTYFGISSNSLSNDVEFKVSDNASKTEIRNAFKKYMSSKKLNKKVLNEFIQLIA